MSITPLPALDTTMSEPAAIYAASVRPVAAELPPLAEFVSVAEAAASLGLSRRTVQRAIQRGELVAVKQGRTVLVAAAALAAFQDRRHGEPDAAAPAPILHLVDLTAADLADLAEREPAAPAPPPPRSGFARAPLPAALTSFVGRTAELATLQAWLARDDARLITLTGIGGVGKTRLAREAAGAAAAEFPGGVGYVSLAAVQQPEHVLPAIAAALGRRDDGAASALPGLLADLPAERSLLVLDNAEHLLAAGPDLAALLAGGPALTLLVTSRTMLRLSGERVLPVAPMPVAVTAVAPAITPPPNGTNGAPTLTDAMRLFVDRAQQARPDFVVTSAQAPVVARLCEHLDGLPLAIELAAARITVLSPAALLARLEHRLTLLTGGPVDQPDRLQTMRGAIAWSYGLLTPAEQALFRGLAIFPGGLSLEAVEAMAVIPDAAGDPASDGLSAVFDRLGSLVNGSLVRVTEEETGQRYEILETVREYAAEQLAAVAELDLARAAQAAYLTAFAQAAAVELRQATNETRLRQVEREHDNIRAALRWTLAHDPSQALALAAAVAPFWYQRGHWTEGREWLAAALAAAPVTGSLGRLRAHAAAGTLALGQSDFPAAGSQFAAARALFALPAIAADAGAAEAAAAVERGLGILASHQSEFATAANHFTTAQALFAAAGDQLGIAKCLNDRGLVATREGKVGEAIPLTEEALAMARVVGDRWQICLIAGNLAGFYIDNGELERGEIMLDEVLALSRELGDELGVAIALHNLGSVLATRGEITAAAARYLELLPIAQRLGEQQLLNRTLDRIGAVLHHLQAPRPAARLFGAAAAARVAIGDTLFEGERHYFEAIWAPVRTTLGDALYDAAWTAGHGLPLAQALTEATLVTNSALVAHAAQVAAPIATDGAASAADPDAGPVSESSLTRRELEVLRLIAAGRSDREIAETLFVARTTASKHVSAILGKLAAGSRTEAVAVALRDRLL